MKKTNKALWGVLFLALGVSLYHFVTRKVEKKKILIYGAGVIGSFLAHVLCQEGHDVSILARGRRYEQLKKEGLITKDYVTNIVHQDHPTILKEIGDEKYDIVFVVMQYTQIANVLHALARIHTPRIVLVGNNLDAHRMQEYVMQNGGSEKQIYFGFQVTAGSRETSYTNLISLGKGCMYIGSLGSSVSQNDKDFISNLSFCFRFKWIANMDNYLKHHLDLILPIMYIAYRYGCDLKKATKEDIQLLLDSAQEIKEAWVQKGVSVEPKEEVEFYEPGFKRDVLFKKMLELVFHTKIGELIISHHCRHALIEMRALDESFWEMMKGVSLMKTKLLRSKMPSWEELEKCDLYKSNGC